MAGFINPAIIVDASSRMQPPADPVGLAGAVQQLQQRQALAPIQQQQAENAAQSGQLENQLTQQKIKDQQAFSQAVINSGGDPDKMEAAAASISDPYLQIQARNLIAQERSRLSTMTEQQYKTQQAQSMQMSAQLNAAANAPDDATFSTLMRGTIASAQAMKRPDGTPFLPTGITPDTPVSRDTVRNVFIPYLDANASFATSQAQLKKDQSDAEKAQVEADAEAYNSAVQAMPTDQSDPDIQSKWTAWRAKLPTSKQGAVPAQFSPSAVANVKLSQVPVGQQPEYQIHNIQANAAQSMTPNSIENSIATAIPPAEHPQEFKDALSRAMLNLNNGNLTPNMLDAITKDGQDRLASARERINEETNPQVLAARVNTAVTTQRALRQGSNPDLANVAPEAVTSVQNQAIKLDEDYAKAKSATDTLGRVLDLADQGNAAAGANVAAMGAAGINAVNAIKRINPASVEAYGNAGSSLDDIKGKLKKWDGKGPLDQNLLNEIRDLQQTVGQQAYQTYTDSLNSVNRRSRATLGPTLPPPNISTKSSPQAQGGYKLGGTYAGKKYLGGDPAQPSSWQ